MWLHCECAISTLCDQVTAPRAQRLCAGALSAMRGAVQTGHGWAATVTGPADTDMPKVTCLSMSGAAQVAVRTMEKQMQLGMIGLGRMGASMVRRLLKKGHGCVVHDRQPALVASLQSEGAEGAASLADRKSVV